MSSAENKSGCLVDVQKFIDARLDGDSFESFVNFIFCAAMAALDRDDETHLVDRAFGPPGEAGRDMRRKAEIVFSVNGVAMPFEAVMRRFHEQWNCLVAEAALVFVKEKLGDKLDVFQSLIDELIDDLERAFAERLGVKREEAW